MMKWFCCVAAMLLFLISPLCAQGPRQDGPTAPPPILTAPNFDLPDPTAGPLQTQMERAAQIQMERDRQRDLKRETDQLVAMATDLKQGVDKTSPEILSVDLIKKTEKIEKLAKSIRQKMKGD